MNGNGQEGQHRQGGTPGHKAHRFFPLSPDTIEGAIVERLEHGHAEEERFGFAATVANASPPVDESFRQTLRASIVAEVAQSLEEERQLRTMQNRGKEMTTRRLYPTLRLAFGLSVVAALLAFAFVTPQGRSLAQSAFQFFVRTESATLPLEPSAPQLAPEDIDALARRLNEEPDPRTVAIFPANYAPALAEHIKHEVVPLAVGDDLDPVAVQAALGAALPHNSLVDMVLVDQDEGEAAKRVRASLERQLYRLYPAPGDSGAETFGALERRQYVAGLGESSLEPVNVVFENGIELVAGGVVGDPEPGEPLRLGLEWRADDQVEEQVTVFAHLVCNGGHLIAQRDAIPGNGEFPATSWESNKVVRDQFAVPLPEDLPVGTCELQVGIYDTASQRRFQPLGLDGAWHVVIRLFSVGPTGETA